MPVLVNQNLNESCIFLNENHASLSLKIIISECPFQHFIIIIMQKLYSAISVSSMALYNSCNFKKEIYLSY